MNSVKVDTREVRKLANEIARSSGAAKQMVMVALVNAAMETRNEMIGSMKGTPKTGLPYKRGKKTHIASSPGNPPAIDRGGLVRSIIPDVRPANLEVEVGSTIVDPPYPIFLEEGTTKMAARPWIKPAYEKIVPKESVKITAAVVKAALEWKK